MSWFNKLFNHGSSNKLFSSNSNQDEVSKAVIERRKQMLEVNANKLSETTANNEKNEPISTSQVIPEVITKETDSAVKEKLERLKQSSSNASVSSKKPFINLSSKSQEPRNFVSKLQEGLLEQLESNPVLRNMTSVQNYPDFNLLDSDVLQIHFSAQIALSKEIIPKDYVLQYIAQNTAICYHVPSVAFDIQGSLQLFTQGQQHSPSDEFITEAHEITPSLVKSKPHNYTEFDLDIPAMFFAWVTYEPFTDLVGTVFSAENGYDRMDPKYIDQGWKMTNSFHEESKKQSAHLSVFCNENLGLAIFSFRGTESNFDNRFVASAQQWLKNLDLTKKDWKVSEQETCKVHGGFFEQYEPNRQKVLFQAEIYYKAGYTIVFTGHSQGAAVSTIACLDTTVSLQLDPERVYCIPFASPRVGDEAFVTIFKTHILPLHTKRWVSYFPKNVLEFQVDDVFDLVTQVPTELFGFRHITSEPLLVVANNEYSCNPSPIKGIRFEIPKYLIKPVAAHCQQVYLDGLLDQFIPERREAAEKMAAKKPANKIKASVEQFKQKLKNELNLEWIHSNQSYAFDNSDIYSFSDEEKDESIFDNQ